MKKNYTTALFLLITALFIFNETANAQQFVWVKSFGGVNKDKGKDLGVDDFGNQYISGFFQSHMTIGAFDLEAVGGEGDQDVFITKLDINGIPVWAHSMGNALSQSDDYPFSMSVNANGFSATTGKCFGYMKTDNGDSLPGFGMEDMWLVSYDPDGNLNWAKVGGGQANDMGSAVYIDNDQNIYCAGNFNGGMNFFGDSMIVASNDPNIYCAKYNWNGDLLWIKSFGSASSVEVYDLLVDGDGNVFMSGNFRKTCDFGSYSFTSLGDGDGYILKMNPAGDVLWATTFGSDIETSFETASTMSLDASGNVYIAGTFAGNCVYDGGVLETTNSKNILIAAYDPDGNYIWGKAFRGGPGVKFSPVNLSLHTEDNVLLSGIFTGIDTIGSFVLHPNFTNDSADAFIISLSLLGDVNWAINAGGSGHDGAFGIAGNNSAYVYITGNYQDDAEFGTTSLVSNGGSDIWVAKFEKNTVTAITTVLEAQKFQVFPNPFNNEFTVSFPMNTTELTIYNTFGQIVYSRTVALAERQIAIDFNLPAAGIYTLQLKGAYGVTTSRIEKTTD